MEKCTFCIQRIRHVKTEARPNTVLSQDVERLTACAEVCPSGSIVFGNRKEADSAVTKLAESPLSYQLFGELNTKNGVEYLAKLTHTKPHHGEAHGGGHGDGHGNADATHGDVGADHGDAGHKDAAQGDEAQGEHHHNHGEDHGSDADKH